MPEMLEAALRYLDLGFAVIPVKPKTKEPLIKWQAYQTLKPSRDQVVKWWTDTPDANIAIITGSVSGVDVIDVDSEDAMNIMLRNYGSFVSSAPVAKTPGGGYHIYVKRSNIRRKIRVIDNVDYLGDGGCVLAPPSIGVNKHGQDRRYVWVNDIASIQAPELPTDIRKLLLENKESTHAGDADKFKPRSVAFDEGSRDDSLFHLALSLRKQGWSRQSIEDTVLRMAASCNPPFPEKQALAKVKSALEHDLQNATSLAEEVQMWIDDAEGVFSISELAKELKLTDNSAKMKNLRMILCRLKEKEIIVPHSIRRGVYRKVDNKVTKVSFLSTTPTPVDITLPFDLHNHIKIYPGNIILVAGEKDAGKTAILLNVAVMNMHKWSVHYFNSEMGEEELTERISLFNTPSLEEIDQHLNAYTRSDNFVDVIRTGKGNLNIIDFLELHDEFYKMGGLINEIYRKLDGAICVIAIQKNPGTDYGLGGARSVEKPRLVLACSMGEVKITVAKNWKGGINPRGKIIKYKLISGCIIRPYENQLVPLDEDIREPYR